MNHLDSFLGSEFCPSTFYEAFATSSHVDTIDCLQALRADNGLEPRCLTLATRLGFPWDALVAIAAIAHARDLHEQLEYATSKANSQIEAMQTAYHGLFNPGKDFYSWQRDWQDACRLTLGLSDDATVEDINLALLLRDHV